MRVILPEAFRSVPWKNGRGVTHEIVREDRDGGLVWRLSLAEVGRDGPFSRFPGLARILTVVEGAGMVLETPLEPLPACPEVPVAFSGDLEVVGRLRDGPVRDLNLIYDPARVTARMQRLVGATGFEADPGEGALAGIYVLAGSGTAADLAVPAGALALLAGGRGRFWIPPGARALRFDLAPSQSSVSSDEIASR